MTLNEYCTGIADAIREKEGSTGLIPAPDHAARILAIKGGAELELCPVAITNISTITSPIPTEKPTVIAYNSIDTEGNLCVVELDSYTAGTVLNVVKNSIITILAPGANPMISQDAYSKGLIYATNKGVNIAGSGTASAFLILGAPEDGSPVSIMPACYIRGTKIALADGRTKPVEDIAYSDDLLVWDFDNGCYASAKPLWIKKVQTFVDYFRCIFEDGTTLVLINNKGNAHRVFCVDTGKFEYANNCVGKKVMTINGAVKLLSCKAISEALECYNIITDYHMNVYANDVLTSTGLNNLYPVVDMKFVKEDRELIPIDAFEDCPERYYYGMRIGEQVNYSIERLNEKIQLIKALAIEKGDK